MSHLDPRTIEYLVMGITNCKPWTGAHDPNNRCLKWRKNYNAGQPADCVFDADGKNFAEAWQAHRWWLFGTNYPTPPGNNPDCLLSNPRGFIYQVAKNVTGVGYRISNSENDYLRDLVAIIDNCGDLHTGEPRGDGTYETNPSNGNYPNFLFKVYDVLSQKTYDCCETGHQANEDGGAAPATPAGGVVSVHDSY